MVTKINSHENKKEIKMKSTFVMICLGIFLMCFSQYAFSSTQQTNELEPNDQSGYANQIALNTTSIASFDKANDYDWFKVMIDSPGKLHVSILSPPIDIRSYIALYNKHIDYLYVTASAVNQGDDVHLIYDIIEPGFIYIQTRSLNGNVSNETYQLNINFTSVIDITEPNNTIGNARQLTSTLLNACIFDDSDLDWYKIHMDTNGTLELKLTSPMTMKSDISIYDSNFNYMYVNASAVNSGDTTYIDHTFEQQGFYYIRIRDKNSQAHTEPYTLEITGGNIHYIPQNNPIMTENEPNDQVSTSNDISIGETITGSIQEANDKDIYKIQTDITGQLTIKLDDVPDNLILKMLIYNSSFQHVLSNQSSSFGDDFSLIYDTIRPEIIYLKIETIDQSFSTQNYTFSTQLTSVPDLFEPNDNLGDAPNINHQNRIEGYIFKTGDIDWYKIHVSTPGELKINVSNLPKNISPVINLYNSSKENLSGKTGISGMELELVYTITQEGDYYIRFMDSGNNDESTQSYIMTIFGADFNLFAPVATIDSIHPTSVIFGDLISFSGSGEDQDGEIVEYSWQSDIDGFISNEDSFSTSTLSKGTHDIYFKVKDNSGIWSNEVNDVVYVGSSVSDESESNNTIGMANEIAINYPLTSKIQEKGDIDWFKIVENEPGRLTLSITNVPDNLRLSIQLYNRHTEYLYAASNAVSEGDSVELIYDINDIGPYYIRINDISGQFTPDFNYTLRATFTPAVDPQEPNNSLLDIYYMKDNNLMGTIFPSGDIDYYGIWVENLSFLTIHLTHIPDEIKAQISLYDKNYNYLYQSAKALNPGDELTLEYTAKETGYIYIKVNDTLSQAYPGQTYQLSVSGANPDYIPLETPSSVALEPDDLFADANYMVLDMPISGKYETANDQDYFYFTMPFPGVLNATLDNVPGNIRPRIRILKSDKSQVAYKEATNPGDSLSLNTNIIRPDNYYIQLSSFDSSTSDQEWHFKVSAVPVNDPYEPNDNFGDATPMVDMNFIQGYIFDAGDVDWYKISVDNPGKVQVTITDVPQEIRPQIELYDHNRQRMATKLATNYGQELLLAFDISQQGDYFIRVFDIRNNTFSVSPYSLIVNGAHFENFTPQAYIDQISPSVAQASEAIQFEGHGFDQDGDIIAYSWRSSIDDQISDSRVCSLDNLSTGTHIIYFKVKDNDQNWSPETSTILYVGVTAPQEHEPNNVLGEANIIEEGVIYPGSIEKSGDVDFYQLEIHQPGRLTINITNPTGNPMKTLVDMYNPNADYTYFSASASNPGDPITLVKDFTETGIYYIRVRDQVNNPDALYSLTTSFDPVDDPFEPNSDIQTSKSITSGYIINAWIFPAQDQDWYKIKLEKPGTLTLNLYDVPSRLKGHLSIYNLNNQYLYVTGVASNEGDNVSCTFHAGEPGLYFIRFYNQNNEAIPDEMYTLSVNFQEAYDIYEPNSDYRKATFLNQTPMNAYIFPSSDIDYFAFFADNHSQVQIKIDNVPQSLKLKMDLYNKDFGYLYVSEKASENGEALTLTYDTKETGIHYIRLSDQNNGFSSESPYQISISGSVLNYAFPVGALTVEFENNDRYYSANPVGFDHSLTGSFDYKGDQDWYRILVSEKGLLTINLDVASNTQSKLELYQLSATRTAENKGESQTLVYTVSDLSNPYIYLIVSDSNSEISNGSYELSLMFEPIIDDFEPNEDIGFAAVINPGVTQNAYIFPTGDNDWFEINIESPGIFRLELIDVPDVIDSRVYLYNRNKNVLTQKHALNMGEPIDLYYHISEPGKYYIRIHDNNNDQQSTFPYRFMVHHTIVDDQNEPNNSFSSATLLEESNLISGIIFPENDHDWFRFYVPEAGDIRIQLTEGFGIEANIELYNDSKSQMAAWSARNINDGIDMTTTIPAPDFYYIRLRDKGENNISSIPYHLTVSKISCENSVPFARILDIEPNPVLTGDDIQLTGNGWDGDGEITSYEWTSSIDGLIGTSEIIRLNHLSKGHHTICLHVTDTDNNISAPVYQNLYITDTIQYEKEYNNTIEKAIPVSLNEWIKGRIYPSQDVDYYKLFIPQRGLIETIIDAVPQTMFSGLYFYNEQGTYLYQSAMAVNGGDQVTDAFFIEPGWYYAKIYDFKSYGHQSDYGLMFKYTQAIDPYEPANIISMAKPIALNGQFSDALICPEGDIDWYKINITEPGRLSIQLMNIPDSSKMAIDMYNQDLAYLYVSKQAINEGENFDLLFDTSETGIYYIRVRDVSNKGYTSHYTLRTGFTPMKDTNEPNNNFGDATPVTTNEIESYIFPGSDQDYYRFYATQGDVLNLMLSEPDTMKASIGIYNKNFGYTYSAQQANNSGDTLYLSYTIPETGFYYIKIYDMNNGAYLTTYMLQISGIAIGNDPQFSPVISEIEPNNDYGDCNDVALNTAITGKIEPANDFDWYRFYVNSTGILRIAHTNIPDQIRSEMWLYDVNKGQINYRTTTNDGEDNIMLHSVMTAGYYFLRLHDYGNNNSSEDLYQLHISHQPVTDLHEPNDSFGQATHMNDGTIQGFIFNASDSDWYRFYMRDKGEISISLPDVPDTIRPHIRLYNAEKSQLSNWLATNSGQTGTDLITYTIETPGFYFIQFYHEGSNNDSNEPYLMTISGVDFSTAPQLSFIGDHVIDPDIPFTFIVDASDPDNPEDLVYSASNLPPGASFDAITRQFLWIPEKEQAGTYPGIHFEVSDSTYADAEDITITIRAMNSSPILSTIGNQTIVAGQELSFNVTGIDPDHNDSLVFSASNLPQGSEFDPQTKTFRWTPTQTQIKLWTNIYFEVSDGTWTDFEYITIDVISEMRLPVVETLFVDDIQSNQAMILGELLDNGGSEIIEMGFMVALNEDFNDAITIAITDQFQSQLNDLNPRTRYYFKAYAINETGTAYGIMKTFITKSKQIPGDINLNGKIDMEDVLLMMRNIFYR